MKAVIVRVKHARTKICKSNLKGVRKDKIAARRKFRRRLKHADGRCDFDGYIKPAFTDRHIT